MTSLSEVDNGKDPVFHSCPDRFKWELRSSYPLFSVEEPSGRLIDVQKCFAPKRPCCLTLLLRLVFLGWSVQVLYDDVVYTYPKHNLWIYLGYLTHWGHCLTILYFTFSCLCCVASSHQPLSSAESTSTLIKWTWGLYSLVAPLELAITTLYWGSGIAQHTTYATIMEHGVLASFVWIDGIFIGNIPVRAKQVVFLITTAFLYLLWTIINALFEIGNGEWGPAYTDDALYPILNWNTSTRAAAILSAFVLLILAPALFYTCWLASLTSPPLRQRKMTEQEVMEEGSRCCCHGFCGSCCWVCDGSRRPLYENDTVNKTVTKDEFDYKEMEKSVMV